MEEVTLEQIVRRYIALPAYPSKKGWYEVLCKVCNDHGRKGLRAGFMFDQDSVAYHCFNCNHNAVYDPTKDQGMPKPMERVLQDFGVPEDEWQKVLFTSLANRDAGGNVRTELPKPKNIEPEVLKAPPLFYFLKDADPKDKWATIAKHYLDSDRGIDYNSYPFMLSQPTDDVRYKKWNGRLIIPVYKGNNLIFWIGRDLTGKKLKKYESPAVDRDRVLYGFDQLFKHTDLPLYIVEGWFDAFVIDGVAVFGNRIQKSQIEWLNKSRRTKVYIPDRLGDGQVGAKQALEAGWHIATPDIGNCKDMSEAVQKYGKLYVMKSIVETTAIGFEADVNLSIFCE